MKYANKLGLPAFLLLAALAAPAALAGPGPVLYPLLTQQLQDLEGKEMHVLTVEYPPGGSDPVHRHDAHAVVYVLEGSVVMGVRGGHEVTLKKGEAWYEGPGDVHTVSRNASSTHKARFLVVFLRAKGAETVLPAR